MKSILEIGLEGAQGVTNYALLLNDDAQVKQYADVVNMPVQIMQLIKGLKALKGDKTMPNRAAAFLVSTGAGMMIGAITAHFSGAMDDKNEASVIAISQIVTACGHLYAVCESPNIYRQMRAYQLFLNAFTLLIGASAGFQKCIFGVGALTNSGIGAARSLYSFFASPVENEDPPRYEMYSPIL